LQKDPCELNNVYDDSACVDTAAELKRELHRIQKEVGDERYAKDID